MKRLILIAALAFPTFAQAQSQEDVDKGFITELIEDNLSGDTRIVNIVGFAGALSSAATMQQLTVADSDGVWLTLDDVTLDWNRSALLRGAIDVQELSAAKITVARAPLPDTSVELPDAEATPFALPELPVSINLESLNIAEIALADVFLGEPVTISLTGSASLAGGEGAANVEAIRLDERSGRFIIDGSYSNVSKVLSLDLDLAEDADGIIARLLDLPGKPSVALELEGTGPLSDYTATLTLATDNAERLAGDLTLTQSDAGQAFSLDVGGDVTSLFAPEYQDFFGPDVSLVAAGIAAAEGGFDLSELTLSAQHVTLDGTLRTDANGLPEMVALTGEIIDATGKSVLLPLAGDPTFVQSMDLVIAYDRQLSDDWTAAFDIADLARPGLAIDTVRLNGGGTLVAADTTAVAASFAYGATGLTLDDVGMAEALGNVISGDLQIDYQSGTPTRIERLTLSGPGIDLTANAEILGPEKGLRTTSNVTLNVDTLTRFATLTGLDLSGAASLDIASIISPFDGFYEIELAGDTQDLGTGIAEVDGLISGAGTLALQAERDTAGTRLNRLRIATPAAEITANANITSIATNANFAANIVEVRNILKGVNGPAQLTGTAQQAPGGPLDFVVKGTAPDLGLTAQGTLREDVDLRATGTLNFANLATYNGITGQTLSGTARLDVQAEAVTDGSLFDVTLNGQTVDLQTGISQLDPLLKGQGAIGLTAQRTGPEAFALNDLQLKTPAIQITGSGAGSPTGPFSAAADIALTDIGRITPGLSGPLTANVTADRDASGATDVDLTATAPGANVTVDARIAPDLLISGNAKATVASLAPYQRLIGQPVRGGFDGVVVGTLRPDLSELNTEITLRTQDIGIGNPSVDQLLRGTGRLSANVARSGAGLNIRNLSAETNNVSLTASLNGTESGGSGQFNARLRDIGLFTDQLSGPVTAVGTASRNGTTWGVNADATGPGGIGAQLNGTASDSGNLNIRVTGNAPLGLANEILAPRRLSGDATFNAAINGPPALSSVSGRVNIAGARLAAPTLGQSIEDISGFVSLAASRADINITGNLQSGGQLAISGPVALASPNNADITVSLGNVILKDPTLYESSVDGTITVRGPLAGGALIAGTLGLGPSEIQVPSSSLSALGELPNVVHFGESAPVRQTLNRADVNASAGTNSTRAAAGPAYPLDITINAPSRIFIRGRGLDAELGGSLNLGGTTANVIPVGRFSLIRGRLDILQQRFDLTEGTASLQGDFEPYIRLVASTEASTGTVINIVVEGPASAPEVTFQSTPELPQDEVLSQLIFGRNLSEISPLQAVQLAAAVSTLAGNSGGGLIDDFRQNLGLDDFDVTTDDEGNAAVRAGAYVSENVYTDVTVSSDGSTEVNINLDITDEITAKGTVDADGETSIGIFFEKDY